MAYRRVLKVVTISLCPCWDVTCYGSGLDWGEHAKLSRQERQPAGKALNVSKTLAWMGVGSVATGLWGAVDYNGMLVKLRPLRRWLKPRFTEVPGSTRENITVVDSSGREMHLRSPDTLATKGALRRLRSDLDGLVDSGSLCVFAGSMPDGELLGEVSALMRLCHDKGAKVVVDTSGEALGAMVELGNVSLIKPNMEEFCELIGREVRDTETAIAKAATEIVEKVEIILISRGAKGAMVVTRQGVWSGRCKQKRKVINTVACGDALLAGFLYGLAGGCDIGESLRKAITVATARAWGWIEKMDWSKVDGGIDVEVKKKNGNHSQN